MKKIIVASHNPLKIAAVQTGVEQMFPTLAFEIQGVSVPSGVSDQPMTDAETLQGAMNRATNAQQQFSEADFWVGVEGGIAPMNDGMEAFAWIVFFSKSGKIGKAKTASFELPPKVVELIHQGYELGDADDIVFGKSNSKQTIGAAGLLTQNVINRKTLYLQAVVLALIPFKNPKLY